MPTHARRSTAAFLAAIVLLAAASALLASAPRAHAASTVTVEISNFAFQPATVTIQVGDTVTWTNLDGAAHTATDTGPQALFDGVMDNGESFSYTFTQAGTVNYFCSFHPEMTGTVIVQAAAAPSASQVPDAAMPQPADDSPTPGVLGSAATMLGAVLLMLSLLFTISGKRRRA